MADKSPILPVLTLDKFLRTLRGTEKEVWGKLLRAEARAKAMTAEAWHELLAEIEKRPAHPADPAFQQKVAPQPLPNPKKRG